MNAEIEDFGTGFYGVSISMKAGEIAHMIELLEKLRDGKQQYRHFHCIREDFASGGKVADIEFCVQDESVPDTMAIAF